MAREERLKRFPVRLLGVRHDQLDAAPQRDAAVLQSRHGVQRARDRPLVVLRAAADQAAGLGHGVERERVHRPRRGIGRLHVAVGHETQAAGRGAEPHDHDRAAIGEIESQLRSLALQVRGHRAERRMDRVVHAVAVHGGKRHEIGERRHARGEIRRVGVRGDRGARRGRRLPGGRTRPREAAGRDARGKRAAPGE